MGNTELLTSVAAGAAPAAADVAPNDFDLRWTAWVADGRAHEQRVRRRILIWLLVVAIAAAIVFAALGS